jgi:hypothetical protein
MPAYIGYRDSLIQSIGKTLIFGGKIPEKEGRKAEDRRVKAAPVKYDSFVIT